MLRKNQRSRRRLPLLGLAFIVLLGLSLAAPAAAQPVKDTRIYKISQVFDAGTRSAIAATGADIFEVGHDYILVEATSEEARALGRPGLTLEPQAFIQAFPPTDSAYHDYAEMVAELNQAAFDHPSEGSGSLSRAAGEGRGGGLLRAQ
jgi:carboxypeptidase T